jgi:hypothetical protein
VILEQQDWPVWLGEAEGEYAALLRAAPDGLLRVWPVDRRVSSPRNSGPELHPDRSPYRQNGSITDSHVSQRSVPSAHATRIVAVAIAVATPIGAASNRIRRISA